MSSPNIILIIFDDICVEQLQRMPQLMKLSKKGVNFVNCYTTTALCQPARTTILTGQYSHNHGLIDNTFAGVSTNDVTTMLPARLQAAGYKTCHVGKYNNSYAATDAPLAGWNEWHAFAPSQYFGFSVNDNGVVTTKTSSIPDYHTNVVNNRALAFINSTTQPFFMQVSFKCPHSDEPSADNMAPVPSPVYTGSMGSKTAPRNANFNVKMGTPPAYMSHAAMDSTKIAEVDTFWRGQSEMLFSADQTIANMVAATAAMSNTIFIITADHGIFHGEGIDPCQKVAPYLPDSHIPLIISGPSNLVAQDKICSILAGNIDIAPTIYSLTGATSTRTVDGVSLVSLLLNPNGSEVRSTLFLEWLGNGNTGWGALVPNSSSILSKQYFYTVYSTGETELYDLQKDPYQLTNVVADPAYSLTLSQLSALISKGVACLGGNCLLQ